MLARSRPSATTSSQALSAWAGVPVWPKASVGGSVRPPSFPENVGSSLGGASDGSSLGGASDGQMVARPCTDSPCAPHGSLQSPWLPSTPCGFSSQQSMGSPLIDCWFSSQPSSPPATTTFAPPAPFELAATVPTSARHSAPAAITASSFRIVLISLVPSAPCVTGPV